MTRNIKNTAKNINSRTRDFDRVYTRISLMVSMCIINVPFRHFLFCSSKAFCERVYPGKSLCLFLMPSNHVCIVPLLRVHLVKLQEPGTCRRPSLVSSVFWYLTTQNTFQNKSCLFWIKNLTVVTTSMEKKHLLVNCEVDGFNSSSGMYLWFSFLANGEYRVKICMSKNAHKP